MLEIGTGSGYQTALLAEFAGQVYTIERIRQLSERAQAILKELGAANVHYKIGDGSEGWEEHAPYDRIITTAAAGRTPEKLLEQLCPGGIAIMPIGPPFVQDLMRIYKRQGWRTIESANCVDKASRFVELDRAVWLGLNDLIIPRLPPGRSAPSARHFLLCLPAS